MAFGVNFLLLLRYVCVTQFKSAYYFLKANIEYILVHVFKTSQYTNLYRIQPNFVQFSVSKHMKRKREMYTMSSLTWIIAETTAK